MHYHSLHIVLFLLSYASCSCCVLYFSLSLSLSHLASSSWYLESLFLRRTRYDIVVPLPLLLLPSLLIMFGFVMRRQEMTSLRTFLTEQFIQNARSFCLTFQTLLYLVCLALKDGLLYVRNSRGSRRVHTGVLLQYSCYRYFCASVYYGISWHTYRSYPRTHFQGTTCP